MKKNLSFLPALLMTFALLTGCGAQNAPVPEQNAATETPTATGTPTPTEAPTPAPTEEPLPEVDLKILCERDDSLRNTYMLLAVNPDAPFVDETGNAVEGAEINTVGAAALIRWLLSEEGATAAADYGLDEYGERLFCLSDERPTSDAEIPAATEENRVIRLSTEAHVTDSGLLGCLLPLFGERYGYEVEVYSAEPDRVIANARTGSADLLLVSAGAQEETFVSGGFACVLDGMETERMSCFYDFYVLCGPSADPCGAAACASVKDAFAAIAGGGHAFVSRGDNSGVRSREIGLWPAELGIAADAESLPVWYVRADGGMSACLTGAEELGAYTLADKAAFLSFAGGGIMP